MPIWKLILAYDGTAFHGWQIQPQLPTVQGTLGSALHRITGERVLPQGSGRTDTGVHALGQVASFRLDCAIPPGNLLRALNRALPPAIRVLSAEHAPADPAEPPFHARHSALRKTYEYRIFPRVAPPGRNGKDATATGSADRICPPMLAPYVWDCPWPIDLARAQQAASHVLGTHDFTSFAAVDPDLSERSTAAESLPLASSAAADCVASEGNELGCPSRGALRTIFFSEWHEVRDAESPLVIYRVTGSGFLHHMVRNLVGTFVEAASGRLGPDEIPRILAARDRRAAGPTAPARGLFLVSVEYPSGSAR